MRKFIFGFVFFATAVFCSAQIIDDVDFYGGATLFNETSRLNGPNTAYESASVSLGISAGINLTDFVRLKLYLDFLIPVSFSAHPDGKETIHRDNYDFLLGMNEALGVVFNIVKKERLAVPVMVGFHGKIFFSTLSDYFTVATTSGIGVGIGAEYAITEKVYFLARVNGFFDFLGFSMLTPTGNAPEGETTKFDVALIRVWGIAPHIGIGIRF